ncbi:hypothetical protein M9H77_25890 [Catharanthus roseus]|uniref:Uncharacterized protein n=1 Tax=Catharanthus roseus TaxID=4058 RepID=A0ACC0A9H7_CATRO|nr:hypothetical protein M9H77_25890 [Catharanthus roseus]
MEQNPSSSCKVDRKTIEKNRRNHMKSLFSNLSSLVPHHSREVLSLPDQLEEATNYIKKLQIKLERMRERRDNLAGSVRMSSDAKARLKRPRIEVNEMGGSVIEVILITGSDCQFMFTEVIRVLHEERAEIVRANYSVKDNTVFHIIHSKIAEFEAYYGSAARVSERLRKIVDIDK